MLESGCSGDGSAALIRDDHRGCCAPAHFHEPGACKPSVSGALRKDGVHVYQPLNVPDIGTMTTTPPGPSPEYEDTTGPAASSAPAVAVALAQADPAEITAYGDHVLAV